MSGYNPYAISTVKLSEEELLRAAKEADERALAEEASGGHETVRPSSTYPEIVVSFEPDIPTLELEGLLGGAVDGAPSAPPPSDHSDVRPTWRGEGPALSSVPCVVVPKEDLSWFELEPAAEVVLSMIDGDMTVEAIASCLTIPREHVLSILRELGSHGVIEFH
jgi:hypothetical protein